MICSFQKWKLPTKPKKSQSLWWSQLPTKLRARSYQTLQKYLEWTSGFSFFFGIKNTKIDSGLIIYFLKMFFDGEPETWHKPWRHLFSQHLLLIEEGLGTRAADSGGCHIQAKLSTILVNDLRSQCSTNTLLPSLSDLRLEACWSSCFWQCHWLGVRPHEQISTHPNLIARCSAALASRTEELLALVSLGEKKSALVQGNQQKKTSYIL